MSASSNSSRSMPEFPDEPEGDASKMAPRTPRDHPSDVVPEMPLGEIPEELRRMRPSAEDGKFEPVSDDVPESKVSSIMPASSLRDLEKDEISMMEGLFKENHPRMGDGGQVALLPGSHGLDTLQEYFGQGRVVRLAILTRRPAKLPIPEPPNQTIIMECTGR